MAIAIASLKRIKATDPPRVLIYGPPGLGKTSLASEWPNPAFIQVEDGTPGDIELVSFGKISSYDDVLDCITGLYNEEHDRRTVVIDSLDRLEPLIWAKACTDNNWASIEAPGYGKGYIMIDHYWRDLIEGLNALRRDKGMNVVYVAHSAITQVDDPMTQSYSRFDIRLHKRAAAIMQDEVDAIFFLNQDVTIKTDDKSGKPGASRTRADGGGNRWLYTAPRPAFTAKNRYGIPDKMLFERGYGFAMLQPFFPAPTEQTSEQQTNKANAKTDKPKPVKQQQKG